MCTGAEIGLGVAIGSKVLGGILQGDASRRAGELAGTIEDRNAVIADTAAADSISRGRSQEAISRLRGGEKIAQQTAGYAASGVDVTSGSAVDVESSTALVNELNAQIIRSNAAREAWGFQTQAGNFRLRAQLARQTGQAQGDEAILAGITGGATNALPLLHIGGGAPVPVPDYQLAGP